MQLNERASVDFEAAACCQDSLAKMADKASLIERYCLVLQSLRRAALRHVETHSDNLVADQHIRGKSWPGHSLGDPSNLYGMIDLQGFHGAGPDFPNDMNSMVRPRNPEMSSKAK